MKTRIMKAMLLMLMSMVSVSVQAYDFEDGGLYYNILSGNTVELTFKKSTAYQGNIVIPSKVKNGAQEYTVVSIGAKAFCRISSVNSDGTANDYGSNSYVQSVTIPNTVVSIGDHAFYGCNGLTSVTFSSSLKSIGEYAFQFCTALPSLTIPNSVTTIGEYAFQFCTSLTSIDISTSLTALENGVFDSCSALVSLVIPNSVTRIGNEVFFSCEGLVSLTIPNSVTIIGNDAFSGCTNLSSITFPSSVTSIGENVFAWCNNLNSVKVETGNTKYDSRNDCNAIIETASNMLIAGCKKTIIPSTVTSIGESAFSWCLGLSSITIPNSVSEIGEYAFYHCTDLKGITCFIYHPFAISTNCWDDVDKSIPLYVPQGTKSLYQNTGGWNEFSNIIEMDSSEPSTPSTTTEQGPNYLQIWFKDGHTERHLLSLVKSISATKYDINGFLHSNYQMQQIVMADTTYSYYLSDIESMSFKKVFEDNVKSSVESVSKYVTPIFEQSPTIEEMESHIDEIKAIEGVEDAWRDGSDIVVQVRDWHKVFYKFPLVSEDYDNLVAGFAKSLKKNKQLLARKADGTMLKVAIAFQMTDDSRFDDEEESLLELRNKFAKMGFDAHFIPDEKTGETLDVDFYRRRIFDYDVVFLATHGKYSGGKHYFFTSKETSLKEDVIIEAIDAVTDLDDISVGFCHTGKYLVNFGTFVIVSEDYIKKSGYRFKGSGPHIVFNAACQSLCGNDVLYREHNGVEEAYYGSDAVAKVFFDKGADLYIGATNLTYNARLAGISFFHYMLDGASEDCAFNLLEPKYKYEEKSKHKSALVDLYNPKSKFGNLKSLFLNDVQTEEKDNQDINKEYKENGHVVLEGKVSPLYEKNPGLSFGFRLATEPGVDELVSYEALPSNNADYSGQDPWEIVFSSTYTPEQGKTYYYRAYIYDGSHYNWGEERNFTIEAAPVYPDLVLSQTQLSIVDGNSTTVEITSGSGEYGVTNNSPGVATATVSGTTVTVNAHKPGDATITVKDLLSGQAITITVIVTEKQSGGDIPAYTSCPDDHHPHLIDLGLPSGTKWACCNVGAEKPEDYGGYYSWGETTGKRYYGWEAYIHCDGSYSTCHDIGSDIAGTQYDAATANWGSPWVMPNLEQMEELKNNCTSEWTKENGVNGRRFTGPNGASIFLPAAGLRYDATQSSVGSRGYYWSSTLDESSTSRAWNLNFYSGNVSTYNGYGRDFGLSVRPVSKN